MNTVTKPLVPRNADLTSALVKAHDQPRHPRRKPTFDPTWPGPKRAIDTRRNADKQKSGITLPKLKFLEDDR